MLPVIHYCLLSNPTYKICSDILYGDTCPPNDPHRSHGDTVDDDETVERAVESASSLSSTVPSSSKSSTLKDNDGVRILFPAGRPLQDRCFRRSLDCVLYQEGRIRCR